MLWLKRIKKNIIDSPPLSVIQQLVSEQVLQKAVLTTGRRSWITLRLGYHSLMGKIIPSGEEE
jgi:hypothetical protein